MTNRTKLIVAAVALGSLPGVAFGLAAVRSDGNLGLAAAVAAPVAVVARAVWRRAVGALRNDGSVVATEHGVEGRIEAVEVFWRPGCPFLDGLGRELAAAGVPTNLRNIWEDPGAAAIVRSIAGGHETVPTLIIGPVALVNPSGRLVLETLREHAPHLLGASRAGEAPRDGGARRPASP